MFDQSTLDYFDSLRRLGEMQEKDWVDHVVPFDQALDDLAGTLEFLPAEPFNEEELADTRGFSELLKTLALLRV